MLLKKEMSWGFGFHSILEPRRVVAELLISVKFEITFLGPFSSLDIHYKIKGLLPAPLQVFGYSTCAYMACPNPQKESYFSQRRETWQWQKFLYLHQEIHDIRWHFLDQDFYNPQNLCLRPGQSSGVDILLRLRVCSQSRVPVDLQRQIIAQHRKRKSFMVYWELQRNEQLQFSEKIHWRRVNTCFPCLNHRHPSFLFDFGAPVVGVPFYVTSSCQFAVAVGSTIL